MDTRRLGSTGLKVSVLSLGAMTFGESQSVMKGLTSSDDVSRTLLDRALDQGVNLVDTANVYSEGRSELLLGEWLKGKRERVVLATKCRFPIGFGTPPAGPNDSGLSRHHVIRACEASLRRLQTDVIDLYQVHLQDLNVPIAETLRALDDLVRAGKVRYIACSNYTGQRLVESLWAAERAGTERYASVQLQWSLAMRDVEWEVVPACRAHGLGILVWSPLASGFLSGKYQRGDAPPEGTRLGAWGDTWKRLATDKNWDTLDLVRRIATRLETTPARVALAWLLAKSEVSSVIVGARSAEQFDDNLAALSVKLPADDVAALDKISRPVSAYPYDFISRMERF